MAKADFIRKLNGKRCSVTLEGDNGSKATFDIRYGNVPPDLFIALLELATVGNAITRASEQASKLQGASEADHARELAKLDEVLADTKARLHQLPELLATIVTEQDIDEEDGSKVKPDRAWFTSLPIEHQVAYANSIIEDKQRPTTPSESISSLPSAPEGSTESTPLSSAALEPQALPAITGETSTTQQT